MCIRSLNASLSLCAGAGSVVSYLDRCELEQDVALEAAILSSDEEWLE